MNENYTTDNLDLLYNWIRQGILPLKTFKKILEKSLEEKEKITIGDNKYTENIKQKENDIELFLENQYPLLIKTKKKKAS